MVNLYENGKTRGAIFTIVFLIIITPQGVIPGINYFVAALSFSKGCQIPKRKKKKNKVLWVKVGFTDTYRETSDMFLFRQSMFPLVREELQSIRLLRGTLWNLQGDNLSEIEMEGRKRSHPWKSFVIKDFPGCLIRGHRGDQHYNYVCNLGVPSNSF